MKKWWVDSTEYFCYARNVQDHWADGKIPYESRFGEPFKGPVIPFGAMVLISSDLLQKTGQGSTNLVRKFYLEYSSDIH